MKLDALQPAAQPGFPAGVLRCEYHSEVDGFADWALIWPPEKGDTWIVMIHGHGSHGDQLYTRADIRDMWLPVYRRDGFGILTPNLRDAAWMGPRAAADMQALLDVLRRDFGAARFIFSSGSMGGASNLIYAVLHPQDVAGVVALCPATDLPSYYDWCRARYNGVIKEIADAIEAAYDGDPATARGLYARHSALRNAPRRLNMPIYVSHGTGDALIPVSQARLFAGAMACKPDFTYVEIPDGDHDRPLIKCAEAMEWVVRRLAV
jgi:pimeloyl-ACP methyl ester carboxylesterase